MPQEVSHGVGSNSSIPVCAGQTRLLQSSARLLCHSVCWSLQELSQWRQQQLQESLRNSVLDEEAAAKFSTAAALAAKGKRQQMAKANYDKGLLTAVDTVEAAQEVQSALACVCNIQGTPIQPIVILSSLCEAQVPHHSESPAIFTCM